MTERTECWRCGYMRPTFESCPNCGGSCKPLTKKRQQEEAEHKRNHLHVLDERQTAQERCSE